jgi:DNA-binding transcriptional LysR family regulator
VKGSLTIRHAPPVPLLTFAQLARDPHFTRAAERLGLTQPAVTQHVRQLEQTFGLRLIEFQGRRAALTEAGVFLAERCKRLADDLATLERELREYATLEGGEVHLGATVTIGSYALAPLVAAFRAAHPQITLRVTVENTALVCADVLRGELSFALVEGEVTDPALEVIPYADDTLVIALPSMHRFASRARLRARDVAGEAFVARERGSGTRAQFERAFRERGIEPRVVLELPTGEGIVEAVEAGIGVAVLSTLVTRSAVAEGRIVTARVADAELDRTFHFVRRRDSVPSPGAAAFAALVVNARGTILQRRPPAALPRR